jgi:hypothetical protein
MRVTAPQPGDERRRAAPARPPLLPAAVLLIVLALVPLACGDDGDRSDQASDGGAVEQTDDAVADPGETGDADREQVVEDLKAEVDAGLGGTGAEVTDEQAACAAEGIVDALGVERVAELEQTEDRLALTQDEADRVVPVVRRCVDFNKVVAEQIARGPDGAVDGAAAACFERELATSPVADDALRAALTGTEDDLAANEGLITALADLYGKCVPEGTVQQ